MRLAIPRPRAAGRRRLGRGLAAALVAGVVPSLHAVELNDRVDLHGFGHQAIMRTTGNTYYTADRRASWDNDAVGLLTTVTLTDRSQLWAQVEASGTRGADVNWLFVDYQIDAASRLHAGRVRLPLGFYNETIEVKALQLSTLEPLLYQIYKTGADMVHDAYHGVGFDYQHDFGGGHLSWQVWGGNMYDTEPPDDSRDRRAWGGRVTYDTPIDGLTAMLSAYRQRVELLETGAKTNEDRAIVSLGYLRDAWDLKAEYARHVAALHAGDGVVRSYAWYLQAGYTLHERWTPFVRYDRAVLDTSQASDPSWYQRTLAFGLNYRVTPHLGLRVEDHLNRGYALPVASGEVEAGAGQRRWNMLVASATFSF